MKRLNRESPPINSREAARKFESDVKKVTAEATKSPKKAREYLKSLGIYTPTGRLSRKYAK